MKHFLNWKFFLLLIVALAAFLRFYSLGSNPPSLTWDEASWGYNAYSLGIDGRDEFGRFLPYLYLESFGDFKPPMYAYLDIIPVKLFGLNEFAVRFPSAFFGTLAVLLTFFLTKRIFWKSDKANLSALFASLFLAISPWHILLSRAAFEANVASFFIIFGLWSFLKGVQSKGYYLIFSAISFVLSIYTFNSARIVSPILVLMLAIIFWRKLIAMKKTSIIAFLIGLMLFLPSVNFLLGPQASLRFKEVNIFSDPNLIKTSNQEIANDKNAFWSKIIHNRRFLYSLNFLEHYFDNLNPEFLFINGDQNPKFSTQAVGQMYIWDLVFFALGVLILFRKKESFWFIVPLLLVIGIIPAALARETPHALRTESSLPAFQIITAYGFVWVIDRFRKNKKIAIGLMLLLLLNFVFFYRDYFANYKFDYSAEWQYGYRESIDYVKSIENKYDYVQVTSSFGRPYIYYLFYAKTSPEVFRQTADISRDNFGFVHVNSFDKYIFSSDLDLNENKKTLYVGTVGNIPDSATVLKKIYLLNHQEAVDIFEI